jgi:hypothetical protein
VFEPLILRDSVSKIVDGYSGLVYTLAQQHPKSFGGFLDFLLDTNFLRNLQLDCLELYPNVLEAELPLRPALFLDLVRDYRKGVVAARISTNDFPHYKDLYKDLSEVLSRQLVIVAGINNLLIRGDFNAFADPETKGLKKPRSLNAYADRPFGEKLFHLDDCWFNVDKDVVDNHLRNAIAHFKTEYNDVTQVVTYYPNKEGVGQDHAETIYFLDFMRKILESFREVHYLHHLIKVLFFYTYLIHRK